MMKNKLALMKEKLSILDWLKANDWKPNKVVTGEWKTTDERWIAYLAERKTKRERLDEITAELAVMKAAVAEPVTE